MKELSRIATSIPASPIMSIIAKASALKKQGVQLCNFSAGETDFPPPPGALKAIEDVLKHLKKNLARYLPVPGLPALREALAQKFQKENKINYKPENIIITTGGKQALYQTMGTLLNPGEEIIIPKPYWPTYPQQVVLCHGKPVFSETEDKTFNIKADLLQEKITKKTKGVILTSPCNPSGSVIHKSELKKIADLCLEHDIWMVSDEVYEPFVYDGETHQSLAALSEEVKKKTITVHAASKIYSMTGWRMGCVAAPLEIIKPINAMQGHMTSNACALAQHAWLGALTDKKSPSYVKEMSKRFEERRNIIIKRLNEFGWHCEKPKGAFFALPDVSSTTKDPLKLAENLLDKARVACIPAVAFGSNKHIRFSYATARKEIIEGMDRIEKFLKK